MVSGFYGALRGCHGLPVGTCRGRRLRRFAGRGRLVPLVDADDPQRIGFRHQDTRLVVAPAVILHPPVGLVTEAACLTYHQIGLDQPFFKVWGVDEVIFGLR